MKIIYHYKRPRKVQDGHQKNKSKITSHSKSLLFLKLCNGTMLEVKPPVKEEGYFDTSVSKNLWMGSKIDLPYSESHCFYLRALNRGSTTVLSKLQCAYLLVCKYIPELYHYSDIFWITFLLFSPLTKF